MQQRYTEQQITERLRTCKAIILDGDGVWFTGAEFHAVLPDGRAIIMKSRHHHDGQGLSFMRAIGLSILFATAEGEPMMSVVTKLNNLPSVKNGSWGRVDVLPNLQEKGTKTASVEAWIMSKGLAWSDCAYIGDDRTDWECMRLAGLTATPCNGRRFIREIADIILTREGGNGAVREFAEMVLDARGITETILPSA